MLWTFKVKWDLPMPKFWGNWETPKWEIWQTWSRRCYCKKCELAVVVSSSWHRKAVVGKCPVLKKETLEIAGLPKSLTNDEAETKVYQIFRNLNCNLDKEDLDACQWLRLNFLLVARRSLLFAPCSLLFVRCSLFFRRNYCKIKVTANRKKMAWL